jgi:hypothetical protein
MIQSRCEGRFKLNNGLYFQCNPACISPLRSDGLRCRIGYLAQPEILLLPSVCSSTKGGEG